MATLTVHFAEDILERAHAEAARRGTSVERFVEDRVTELASPIRMSQAEAVKQLMALAQSHPMRLPDGIPSRDEMHER
jgi:hypothetical protein